MAEHKRATEISIASYEEHSAFQELVGKLWKPAVVLLLIGGGALVAVDYSKRKAAEAQAANWATFNESMLEAPLGTPEAGAALTSAAQGLEGTDAGLWANALAVASFIQERDFESASSALQRLRAEDAQHPLLGRELDWAADGTPVKLADYLDQQLQTWQSWQRSYPGLTANPDPEPGSPKVTLSTAEGDIVLQLYSSRAPRHVENFTKLVGEGYYDGTSFHRVVVGSVIQGGDPNSRDEDRSTWGTGGPDHKVPSEDSGLWHFEGFLAAAKKPGDRDSSGSQFYITFAPSHQFDGDYTVFGKVVEGLDVVKAIGEKPNQAGTETPEEPVVITTASVQ